MIIPIKTTGYGITRMEELIFNVTEPTERYASPFELYQKEILPKTGMTSDGTIRLHRCIWLHKEDNSYVGPGTILYVPNGKGYEADQRKRKSLCAEITEIIIGLIQNAGLSCKSRTPVYNAVNANLGPFKAIREYRVVQTGNHA